LRVPGSRGYLLQTHEMLFDAHNHAFRVLGGVPRRGIYDNMRTAVDKVGRGKARQVNARFSAMASHFVAIAQGAGLALEHGQVMAPVINGMPGSMMAVDDPQ